MLSEECGMWNAAMWDVKMQKVEGGLWNAECGTWDAECCM